MGFATEGFLLLTVHKKVNRDQVRVAAELKGSPCSSGEEAQTRILMKWWDKLRNIYLFHKWINKLSSEENEVPEHCFKLFGGSGVEPASCYWMVVGLIPLLCMSTCLWATYWTPNCSWCAGRHLAWQPPTISVRMNVRESLLIKIYFQKWQKAP